MRTMQLIADAVGFIAALALAALAFEVFTKIHGGL